MTLRFAYSHAVTMPRRLAGVPGQERDLAVKDAERLAADGVGQIITVTEPPAESEATSIEPAEVDDDE